MANAYISRAETQQRISWIGGSVQHVVLDGAATENRLAAFRSSMRGGAASPVHVHDRDDETIFVLEGEGVFWAGDQRWRLTSGDTAFLPRGVPHAYSFTSDSAEVIAVCNPAGMEDFFRSAGWDLASPPPPDWAVDADAIRSAAEACGQRVLGPPLAVDDEMPTAYLEANRQD